MPTQHEDIVDPYIHEPKGVADASADTVYVADGAGSGSWKELGTASIDVDAILADVETAISDSTITLSLEEYIHAQLVSISTASSVIIPITQGGTLQEIGIVLGGSITDSDATISVLDSAGASLGAPVTIAEADSGKGDYYTFTATGNNTFVGPTWFEITTDGASSGDVPVFFTMRFQTDLND